MSDKTELKHIFIEQIKSLDGYHRSQLDYYYSM